MFELFKQRFGNSLCRFCKSTIVDNRCPECDQQCNICKGAISNKQDTIQCFQCDSFYHSQHLLDWYKINDFCPLCKENLDEEFQRSGIKQVKNHTCVFCLTPVNGSNCSRCERGCSMCFKAIRHDQDYTNCRNCGSLFHQSHSDLYAAAYHHCRFCASSNRSRDSTITTPYTRSITETYTYKNFSFGPNHGFAMFFTTLMIGLSTLLSTIIIDKILTDIFHLTINDGLLRILAWSLAVIIPYLTYVSITTTIRTVVAYVKERDQLYDQNKNNPIPLKQRVKFYLRSLMIFDRSDYSNYLALIFIPLLFLFSIVVFTNIPNDDIGSIFSLFIDSLGVFAIFYIGMWAISHIKK